MELLCNLCIYPLETLERVYIKCTHRYKGGKGGGRVDKSGARVVRLGLVGQVGRLGYVGLG